jgi:hypothetical protein
LRASDSNISEQNSTSRPRTHASSRSDKPATGCILTSLDDGNAVKRIRLHTADSFKLTEHY